jgi:Fe-S cluster assembly scaffold protein SufB
MNIVSESGLYSLVLSSRKKEAKTFKRWVTHDILPEIRKTGGYNPEQSEVYKTKRLEIMAMNAKARIMKEQNKRLEIMLKNNELEGLSVTAIQAILNEHPQTEKTYSATEAAEMFGVSANKIGRLANAHGLKCDKYGITVLDKAKHCDKEVQSFRYNEKGIEKLKELLREE